MKISENYRILTLAILISGFANSCSRLPADPVANNLPNTNAPAVSPAPSTAIANSAPLSNASAANNSSPYTNRFSKNAASPVAANDSAAQFKSSLTIAEYDKLKIGMDYAEVVRIFGREGVEVMKTDENGVRKVTYKWEGVKYVYVVLTFENDKLIYKSQANLDKK